MFQKRSTKYLLGGIVGIVTQVAVPATLWAQESQEGDQGPVAQQSEDAIVVTASRRGNQTIQDVPMAITAVSGEELAERGIQSIQDLTRVDSSLAIRDQGATKQTIVIRGVASDVSRTVGVYLDEAPLLGGFNDNSAGDGSPSIRLHDIERVEVLSGPQGTLFGAGSMAGTVRFITNRPDTGLIEGRVEASASVTDGGNPTIDGNVMLNLPVVQDMIGLRFVAWGEDGGGYIDHTISGVVNEDVNDRHVWGFRAQALFEPSDVFSLLASYNYQTADVDGAQRWTQTVGPTTAPDGPINGPYPAYENHAPSLEPFGADYELLTLTAELDVGVGSIIATGARSIESSLEVSDSSPSLCSFDLCEGAPFFPLVFTADLSYKVWTGEARFSSDFAGPFQLVAGVYYEDDDQYYSGSAINVDGQTGVVPCVTYDVCLDGGFSQPGFGGNPVFFSANSRLLISQWAFYAQGDLEITPSLTATAGIRHYTADLRNVRMSQQDIPDSFGGVVTTPVVTDDDSSSEKSTNYNFSLLWEANPDLTFYARAASGFRIGGVNQAGQIADQLGLTVPSGYGPDQLWNYEVGMKMFMANRDVLLDISAFHLDWTGQQQSADAAGVFTYTLNVGSTKIDGVQATLYADVTEELSFNIGATYVEATLGEDLPPEVVAAGTIGLAGDTVPQVPKFSLTGNIAYETPISDDADFYAQAGFVYRDSMNTHFRQAPGVMFYEVPSYFLADASAGVRLDDGTYDLSIFVRNIGNEVAQLSTASILDGRRSYVARPRTVGVRFVANF